MEHLLQKEQMNAVEALAQTNMEVSRAKESLAKLKQFESVFVANREKKALKAVQEVIEQSHEVIKEAKKNYEDVQQFHNTVKAVAVFLSEAYEKFATLVGDFEQANQDFEAKVKSQEAEVGEVRADLKKQQNIIDADKKEITKDKKQIDEAKKKIRDEEARLARIIERLKNKRI